MAEYISFQPSDFFNAKIYTGTGSSNAITGVGFQPDATWIKGRNTTYNHVFTDAVRGVTKEIYPSVPDAEVTNANGLTAFGADGFTVGSDAGYNQNTKTYVSYNWKAGTTSGIAGSPDITPTAYSFNATSGFSIIQYTGNGANSTLPHGLGEKPGMIIIKKTDGSVNWQVYNHRIGATKYGRLDTNASFSTNSGAWNNTEPTSTLFTIGTNGECNTNTDTYIAYCFAPKEGYSKMGIYYGNANINGPFVYTGFRPAYLLIKRANGDADWMMYDKARIGYNPENFALFPDGSGTESFVDTMTIMSNGFKPIATSADINGNGDEYQYLAIAEFPSVSSNDVPGVAR